MKRQKISAIICAAGQGLRAGFDRNKLLTPLYGAPALYHTLKKFHIPEIDEVIVASSEFDFEEISALCAPFGFKTVLGGKTRTGSVKKALAAVTGEIVLIHDGARPYLSQTLIRRCIEGVKEHRSAVCAVKATDTAVYSDGNVIKTRLDRNSLFLVQTPQGFYTEEIRRAYELSGDEVFTDDSALYGQFIAPTHIIEGERENVKLTYKSDFMRETPAFAFTPKSEREQRIGFGVDVHAFGDGNGITLCGVKIDCDKKLIAHSDGDVVLHAATDALLSAAGFEDIGHYFPDSDPALKGADSGKMLEKVVNLIKSKGLRPINVSVSVQAEKPRLAPHIDEMRDNLCALCGVAKENVAVAAGTCEGLGFVGEGLGIAAYCAVALEKI